jgi:hypothetical protein
MSRLPTIDDRPECNGGSYRHKHKPSVFERLQRFSRPEDECAYGYPDNDTHRRYDPCHLPRWCPDGLSRSQKRRVQRLRNSEQTEEEYAQWQEKARYRQEVSQP